MCFHIHSWCCLNMPCAWFSWTYLHALWRYHKVNTLVFLHTWFPLYRSCISHLCSFPIYSSVFHCPDKPAWNLEQSSSHTLVLLKGARGSSKINLLYSQLMFPGVFQSNDRGGVIYAYSARVNTRPQDGVDYILCVIFLVVGVEVEHHWNVVLLRKLQELL